MMLSPLLTFIVLLSHHSNSMKWVLLLTPVYNKGRGGSVTCAGSNCASSSKQASDSSAPPVGITLHGKLAVPKGLPHSP